MFEGVRARDLHIMDGKVRVELPPKRNQVKFCYEHPQGLVVGIESITFWAAVQHAFTGSRRQPYVKCMLFNNCVYQ